MDDSSNELELVEQGDDGKKGQDDGALDEAFRLVSLDDNDDERDDAVAAAVEDDNRVGATAERHGDDDERNSCGNDSGGANDNENGDAPTGGMWNIDVMTNPGNEERCGCFWGAFCVVYLIPVVIFPIVYWSRAVLTSDHDFTTASQDAMEWILGCTMITTSILLAMVTIGCCWDNRREIRQELSAPAPVQENNFYRGMCNDPCRDEEAFQGFCTFLVIGPAILAGIIWFGKALINGSLFEDHSEDSPERSDETRAQELVKHASPPLGIAILVASFSLLLLLLHPVYSFFFNWFFQWFRRRQGYLPANVSNMASMLSSDEREALLWILAACIPSIVLAIIEVVRCFLGLEYWFLAILDWIFWHFILFMAVVALIGPISLIYSYWYFRNDLNWTNAVAVMCPVTPWPLGETALWILFGGVCSVGSLALGMHMVFMTSEDREDDDIQIRLMASIFCFWGIEVISVGVALLVGTVIYPIYAFVVGCVRDCCRSGRATTPVMEPGTDCGDELTMESSDS